MYNYGIYTTATTTAFLKMRWWHVPATASPSRRQDGGYINATSPRPFVDESANEISVRTKSRYGFTFTRMKNESPDCWGEPSPASRAWR